MGSSEEPFSLYFEFRGAATVRSKWRTRWALHRELVQALNRELSALEGRIGDDLRKKVPEPIKLHVEMEFFRGSVGWEGVVAILGRTALLADNISFVQYVAKAVRFSVNRILRARVEQRVPVRKIKTKVTGVRGLRPQAAVQVVSNVELGEAGPVSKFLWWCAGAVPEIIQDARVDHVKYFGIGGAVLTTGVLAFFSSAYAVYTVFGGAEHQLVLSLLLGLIWALAIFNLDRYLVSSMKKEEEGSPGRFLKELARASPRLLLAIVIGITISKPLELRLFQGPIDERIEIRRDSVLKEKEDATRRALATRFAEIDREIAWVEIQAKNRRDRIRQLEEEYKNELDGTGGSTVRGPGPVALSKLAQLNYARGELAGVEKGIDALRADRRSIEAEVQNRVQAFENKQKSDFSERLRILSALAREDGSVWWATSFLAALLILVEMAPVLVKLMSPVGVYDVRLNVRSDFESAEAEKKGAAIREIVEYHYELLVASEKRAEDSFDRVRDVIREERLDQLPRQGRSLGANGREPTWKELEESVHENIFAERRV